MVEVPCEVLPGLSPRVRGNLDAAAEDGRRIRSIPAGAGEPASATAAAAGSGVYPRGCGGTLARAAAGTESEGLSPRVRGNPGLTARARACSWSIPAGAGEPCGAALRALGTAVYPRGCGGTAAASAVVGSCPGLSPRVRGNLQRESSRSVSTGSIPAGAGEPKEGLMRPFGDLVYPRGCGGTTTWSSSSMRRSGLSPRVRGNLRPRARQRRRQGSIPAGAGEPPCCAAARRRCGVYPRGCGGTNPRRFPMSASKGLSPRVRGNLLRLVAARADDGSIPAGAGEPAAVGIGFLLAGVYPRGCGGTTSTKTAGQAAAGLSPRVRGNRTPDRTRGGADRSISAGAGEPRSAFGYSVKRSVYPRGCGGTAQLRRAAGPLVGLSPRVRGNLLGPD